MKNSPAVPSSIATQSIAILCSLCLCFWGYQTGAWRLAIPMVLLLEARHFLKKRWKLSGDYLHTIHVLSACFWCVAIFLIPVTSSSPTAFISTHHLLKSLPVGFFPLILGQTYWSNFTTLYQNLFQKFHWSHKTINFYYPYFGICLLAASATGGNSLLFLVIITLLIAAFLSILRSQRFTLGIFYGLIYLAMILSLVGAQANVQLNPGALLGQLIENFTSAAGKAVAEVAREAFKQANQPRESVTPTLSPSITPSPKTTASERPKPEREDPVTGVDQPGNNPGDRRVATASPAANPPTDSETNTSGNAPRQGNRPSSSRGSGTSTDTSTDSTGETSIDTSTNTDDLDTPPPNQETAPVPETSSTAPAAAGRGGGRGDGSSLFSGIQRSGGRINPQQSTTRIGQQGTIQPANTVLFRVWPGHEQGAEQPTLKMPLYLKVATFNHYHSTTWNAVHPRFVPKLQTDQQRWILFPPAPGTSTVRISADFQQPKEVLSLPIGTSEIDQLAVDAIQVSQYGTVIAQGKPGQLVYRAKFDPAQSFDSPPTPLELDIPVAEQPALERIRKSLNLSPTASTQETIRAVKAFFQQGFRYSLDLPQPQNKATPIADFLLRHRYGHCEYYATATSLLLRAAGIPTRYAVGYSVHEYDSEQQAYLVRASNAHAWVMAYVDGAWMTLDTTPGDGQLSGGSTSSPVTAPTTRPSPTGSSPSLPQAQPQPTPHPTPQAKDHKSWPENVWATWTSLNPKRKETWLRTTALLSVGLAIVLTSLLLLWRLLRHKPNPRPLPGLRGQHPQPYQPDVDGLDSAFQRLEQQLGKLGLERQPAETTRKWLVRLQKQFPDAVAMPLQELIDLHYRYRFDPQGISAEERAQLKSMLQSCLRATRVAPKPQSQKL